MCRIDQASTFRIGKFVHYALKMVPLLRQKATHYPIDYFPERPIFRILKHS